MDKQIGVGLLGMGVVGGAVARVISEKSEHITNLTDASVEILGVLVRDRKKKRSFDMPCNKYVSSVDDILDNDDIDIDNMQDLFFTEMILKNWKKYRKI